MLRGSVEGAALTRPATTRGTPRFPRMNPTPGRKPARSPRRKPARWTRRAGAFPQSCVKQAGGAEELERGPGGPVLLGPLAPLARDLLAAGCPKASGIERLLEEDRVRVLRDGGERRPEPGRLRGLEPRRGEHLEHEDVPARRDDAPALA